MKPLVKRILLGIGAVVGTVVVGAGAFVGFHVHAFHASLDKVYDVKIPSVTRSSDPIVLARGKHLAESVAPCTLSDCHGPDLGGGKTTEVGPLGRFTAPNVSSAGLGAAYSDGEILRLLRHGLKRDGRTVRFMPSHDFNWLSDADFTAVISYIRTLPPVQKENGPFEIGVLGAVLDRFDMIPLDIARRIDHQNVELAPPPNPSASYGAFLARECTGCHGKTLAGGPIPGAPPDLPIPRNLTPDATGLKGWTFEDFRRTLTTGLRKNGDKLASMMPFEAYGKLDDVEMHALWAYLESLPPRPFGSR
ncbi:MAG TPA: c-type cytochrome [Polyangiaceae bacterium]|nr:c-type cytochrome [Polyangiaceae bacterium]